MDLLEFIDLFDTIDDWERFCEVFAKLIRSIYLDKMERPQEASRNKVCKMIIDYFMDETSKDHDHANKI